MAWHWRRPLGAQPCSRANQRPANCQDDQRKAARISQLSQLGRRFCWGSIKQPWRGRTIMALGGLGPGRPGRLIRRLIRRLGRLCRLKPRGCTARPEAAGTSLDSAKKNSKTGVFCQAWIFVNIKSGILPLQIKYFVPRLRISFYIIPKILGVPAEKCRDRAEGFRKLWLRQD